MILPHHLDRTVTINAPRDIVFSFFTDSARWAAWWGAGSTIDARVGGRILILFPGNVEVVGEVLDLHAPDRVVFTYGFSSGEIIPPGGSRVTIELDPEGEATSLRLRHDFSDVAARDEHIQGWRYQLSLFSNAVLDLLHAEAARNVDAWLGLWAEKDAGLRASTLASIASPSVRFSDRFSLTLGADDLSAHIGAAQRFMPGVTLARRGAVRHCQGTVLADWDATGADGNKRGTGTNVFVLGADGRIASATGFWSM